MWPCAKEKPPETERRIKANKPEYNAEYEYANNHICTSKYSIITFLPKNLLEQFRRLANSYFLCLLVLQLIPPISSLPWYSTFVPLISVLGVSAFKDAIDDIRRHTSDNQVNNRLSYVLRDGKLVEEKWHKVVVGDIIRMENNQFVAADLLLLSSSEPHSLCYIETAELDGETNLKVRQAIPETSELQDEINRLSDFNADIVCEAPNNNLSKFEGKMEIKQKTFSLDNEKILLRGCVLRNTKWCYGLVIFAGKDTKLMMNSGKAIFKRTNIDRLMNVLIIGIFLFLQFCCLVMTVAAGIWETYRGNDFQIFLPWDWYVPGSPDKDGSVQEGATVASLLVFFSYIIILNTVVPISLYVSVEIIRLVNSLWINWDVKMFYDKVKVPAKARTTTLNEELGQIEYIFSDKTGTLTQNLMEFKKCSIDGKSYGDAYDEFGNSIEITENTPKVDLSSNIYAEPNFEFYDRQLISKMTDREAKVELFFTLLALCHTVMPETKDGKLEYQAQSPDEGALVSAARNFGYVFKSRTPRTITVEIHGEERVYELLNILDFNNVRKRMSVIVRYEGKIQLLCKGADSLIYERLDASCADLKELTTHHLNDFASEGLRTLCLSYKDLTDSVYENWKAKHHIASTAMENRDEKLDAVYEEIENNMILIGATAIEDKLQDGVPDTIANLAMAGIKIWVLTGDKQETAINIGYSCQLITDEMEEVFIVDGETYDSVQKQLQDALDDIKRILNENKKEKEEVSFVNGGFANGQTANVSSPDLQHSNEFALVINGHSLIHALHHDMEQLLLDLGCSCKAVICCRVTPLQKAMVVDLVKRNKKSITLAIGDGANDVSMIKTAHIGVGISGQEGMQAVLASDFSFCQFRYLERLLLVHGRWSYFRMCKFLKYFFYKNFAFTLCHFWYAFFCGFSAQTLFDPYFITFYNVFYTSLPVLMMGVFDQDVNEYYSIRYPKLYTPGLENTLFNKKVFAWSITEGIITSLVLFFIPYGAFHDAVSSSGTDMADSQAFGVVVASILVVVVNLRCGMDTSYWTGFSHVVVWGSCIFYYCFILAFYAPVFNYVYQGTAYQVFGSAKFWFCLILTNVVILLPVVAYRFYILDTKPTLSDRIRLKQRMTSSKSRFKDLHLRRASTMRRSTRSLRSGYAFSHSQGFGELITSGINMRQRAQESGSPVMLTNVKKIDENAKGSILHKHDSGHHENHENHHVVFSERL